MSELEAINQLIKKEKAIVGLSDSLKKLKTNRDFKKVFLDHYGKEYAAGLVRGKADTTLQTVSGQNYVDDQINAISHLFQFMDKALIDGEMAEERLIQHGHERDMIMEEV